jgi:hypothetical protein
MYRLISRYEPGWHAYNVVSIRRRVWLQQPPARTHGFTGVVAHSPLVDKGNKIQRYWRLSEITAR